ncbi:LIP [Symbiodinium necroappetens]|uniref:LIP protein n=1 Tax=Symbiodinium necroappetens TaxID=1628268 RepID=A0A812WY13_9DINO|nr:LIP [Symbiodinium necroappetens]
MFAGSIQDRLRAREDDRIGTFRQRSVPLNVSGHPETVRNYSSKCHHIAELKEKARRIEALEKQLVMSEEARSQLTMDIDVLSDKLEQASIIRTRNETIIESQKQAIQQLQLALRNQQKAVEAILGEEGAHLANLQRQVETNQTSLRQALQQRPSSRPGQPGQPGQLAQPAQRPAPSAPQSYGLSVFGGETEKESEDSEETESSAPSASVPRLTAPTAKLHTPGTTPRTAASSPRTASPAASRFI